MRYLTVNLNSGHYVDDDVPLIHPLLRVGAMALIGGCFGALALDMGAIAATLMDATPVQGSPQTSSRPLPTSGFLDVPTDAPVVSDDGYILGAGDRLKLDFFSLPEFSGEYAVLPNGAVNLPQVGMVSLQGYTVQQASQILATRYGPILTRPVININVTATRPVMIAIAGEIERPGAYSLVSATGESPMLSRAIQQAEGITRSADLQRVKIRRRTAGGGNEVIAVNLLQLLRSGDARQDIRLRDGDSILIPVTAVPDLALTKQLLATNLASRNSRPIQIAVVGEVLRPGPHILISGGNNNSGGTSNSGNTAIGNTLASAIPTLTQAIQQAGGISQMADIRNIQVRRTTRFGTEQKISVNFLKLLESGDLLQDVPLQEGDTVEIPIATALSDTEITRLANASFSPDKMTVNVVGEVERPGALVLPPNTPLNQAVLTAGGFNKNAVKNSITLVRLNPNGTVTKRDISFDLSQNLNEASNPALRNNDIIVVKKTGLAIFSQGLNDVLSPFVNVFGVFRLFGGR
ncbi:MAG: SLBB domain-containing protein [Alkalinema sp. CAN_BIN05]|nr:SLBB domain-containing protein [Alkalinema sp. CAN_BIN05]